MCSIDLQDAYFHVPVSKMHQKFLRFRVSSQHYRYAVLPFGLKSAPRTFTKSMAVVAAFLRRQKIFIYPYLDDWLLKSSSPSLLQDHLATCLHLLNNGGLQLNYKKSILNPTQKIHYLGASLDTVRANVCPSEERWSSLQEKCLTLLHEQFLSVRQVSSLLGSMASCIFIVPNARLHMHPLQQCLEDQWRQVSGRWEDRITLDQSARNSIRWWLKKPHIMQGVPLHQDTATQSLVTDASLQGWGAHMGPLQIQGLWSDSEKNYHINLLERGSSSPQVPVSFVQVLFHSSTDGQFNDDVLLEQTG